MPPSTPIVPSRRVRVVLSSTAFLSFVSVWKAAALSIAELGVAAFFLIGVVLPGVGRPAPWLVLGACLLGPFVRSLDVESWSLLIPGGLVGRAKQAFGPRSGRVAAAVMLTERLLLAALASTVVGHYLGSLVIPALALRNRVSPTIEDTATLVAVIVIGLLWTRARLGRTFDSDLVARGVWIAVAILIVTTVWSVLSLGREGAAPLRSLVAPVDFTSQSWIALVLTFFYGAALSLPAIGGGEALARTAHELPPPRVHTMRRASLVVFLFAVVATALPAFLFVLLVNGGERPVWFDAPLSGLARHLAGPAWVRALVTLSLLGAALLTLIPAAQAALIDAEQVLRRLSADRVLPEGLASAHPRFGTLARAIDVSAAAAVLLLLTSGGRVEWLGRAYAFAMGATLLVKIATLLRFRRTRREPAPFKAPFNLMIRRREIPVGLFGIGLVVTLALASMLAVGDAATIAALGLSVGLTLLFTAPRPAEESTGTLDDTAFLELLPSTDLVLDQVQARPGNVLIAIRNPHSLDHVAAALRASGDRDIVVMTVRLLGIDVDDVGDEAPGSTEASIVERQLFARVIALAERHGRTIRLMIVPARSVPDALVATVVRLRSSEIYVGESMSLTADDQARLLGDAWERAEQPEHLDVRLVIYHHSGRTDAYHIGAHPPALTAHDLDLIHRVWLDARKAIGPHVHHRDVVRAALIQMEQQLTGPQRDQALDIIRQVARPADELAAAVRQRDFSRLRDMVRNRDASDLAVLLTDLSLEDQVVFFRVLPRKDAAAVFEYLSLEAQETLLKAMAQEDIATLLNNMAPDDRTMFLEELPAAATRQLLTLLSPKDRSVALTLLGYPEDSVGRLMTPHYVAAREHWTIRELLDFIRQHGQDSETLNVIYVVDDQGLLIDDIRIRELLLAPLDNHVADLMDRHFVALKATDDQQTAVSAFRRYDRTALPVTDTAGMLIGIVTIDDVLDVAEAAATQEIQRFGGTEALDEPYMKISFGRMIQKRGGWLTALFLGELLTATAMGAFEAEISRAVVLALFVPLIISSGGNSGSQASTLVIRALALGEVGLGDWWRVMRREIRAGLVLGAILGSIGFLRITVWSAFSSIYGEHWLLVAFTVAIALIGIVLWGTLIGSLLPFLLRRLGFDPATSSAPFVATLVDVTGLVIYFSVALVILRGTLL